MTQIRINDQRLLTNLAELAQIGSTGDGGVNRPAFSEMDVKGREWFEQKVKSLGFDYTIDGAANQSAVLHSADPK